MGCSLLIAEPARVLHVLLCICVHVLYVLSGVLSSWSGIEDHQVKSEVDKRMHHN